MLRLDPSDHPVHGTVGSVPQSAEDCRTDDARELRESSSSDDTREGVSDGIGAKARRRYIEGHGDGEDEGGLEDGVLHCQLTRLALSIPSDKMSNLEGSDVVCT